MPLPQRGEPSYHDDMDVQARPIREPARAAVVFEAPHGSEAVELWDGEVAEFGRSRECAIRFAYAPRADLFVHGVAGRFSVLGGRVHVEAAAHAKPLEIEPEQGPQVFVAVDEARSCRARNFTVVVPGKPDPWLLKVSSRSDEVVRRLSGPDAQTAKPELDMNELDWLVLRSYAAPLLRGGAAAATHGQVAAGCPSGGGEYRRSGAAQSSAIVVDREPFH